MDVAQELDALRAEVDGCDLVAFADLSSQMVLCTSSATKRAQEELDALSGAASLTLDGAVAEGAAALTDGAPATAIAMTQFDMRIFLRNPASDSEALICVCTPDADVGKIVDCGRSTLDRIVASG